jgi:nucleotide-binding universal stress UspA family protein
MLAKKEGLVPTVQKILHPTDFSKYSAAAADYASLLAQQFEAELHVLYVVEEAMGRIPESDLGFPAPGERVVVEQSVWPRLEQKVGVHSVRNHRVLLATRLGTISDQIVSYADDNAIDMIAIGTHGRRGIAHALMGSVAEAVVRKANCPVLTVRAPKT